MRGEPCVCLLVCSFCGSVCECLRHTVVSWVNSVVSTIHTVKWVYICNRRWMDGTDTRETRWFCADCVAPLLLLLGYVKRWWSLYKWGRYSQLERDSSIANSVNERQWTRVERKVRKILTEKKSVWLFFGECCWWTVFACDKSVVSILEKKKKKYIYVKLNNYWKILLFLFECGVLRSLY